MNLNFLFLKNKVFIGEKGGVQPSEIGARLKKHI